MVNTFVTFDMDFGDGAGPVLTAGKVLAVNLHNRGRDRSFVVEIMGMAVTLHVWEDSTQLA